MSNISGTAGDDIYIGNVGIDDTANISSSLAESTFTWDGTNWVVTSAAGVDTLVSIEAAQFADGRVGVAEGAGETQINTTAGSNQHQQAITGLADGGYVVTWISYGPDGSGWGVFAQRYDSIGAAVGIETQINRTTANYQSQPATAALSDGGYVVTWMSYIPDRSAWGIYARRYDTTGAPVGDETLVNSTTSSEQQQPAITGLADGGYVVTWSSVYQDGSGWGVYAQRYDSSGAAVGSETQVNSATANDQYQPAIIALADGGYVVTWSSVDQDGSGRGVYSQRYDSSGAAVGGETKVNSATAQDQYQPAITALADGGYVVTWMSNEQDGSGWGIYTQQYDGTGAAVGRETQVNTTTASQQLQPSITGLADGGYVVTWMAYDGGGYGIYAQRYDATGAAIGGETRINNTTNDDQTEPAITALADGGYVVTWMSLSQDGSGWGIYGQRFEADGSPDMPTLTGDENGNRLVASANSALHLLGAGGNDLLVSGNGNDRVDGGEGDDTLDGGIGADNLAGGSGNDVYFIDSVSDVVVEGAGGGTDTVVSSVSHALAADVENLTLAGTSAIDATGNALDNVLAGNSADNRLDGGAGSDTAVIASSMAHGTIGYDGREWIVTNTQGTDTLHDIEKLQFADGAVTLSAATSGETLVNTTTFQSQQDPAITGLAGGGYVVTWASYVPDSNRWGVYAQRYDSSGAAVGGETQINSTTAGQQYVPAITALADGGYAVTWASYTQDGSRWAVIAQRYDRSGAAIGGETQVNSTTANNQPEPQITGLNDGGYVVTWMSYGQDGSAWGVYTQQYDNSGAAVGGETQVNSATANDQYRPMITALADGGYVVTWMSYYQDGSGWGIYTQRYDGTGSVVGGETQINSTAVGEEQQPAITGLDDGGYVVTWISYGQDGSGWNIHAMRFDSTGAAVGGETQINSTAGDQTQPAVTALADGGYVVTWMSLYQDGSDWNVYAQRYDDTGAAVGGETRINSTTASHQYHPAITDLADGGYVVTWMSHEQDGSSWGIYTQRFAGPDKVLGVTADDAANTLNLTGAWNYDVDGAGGDDMLRSGRGADRLDGSDGNDTLQGGAGVDTLVGGAGNDLFLVGRHADRVIEAANGGMDLVISTATSHTLDAGVENLLLRAPAVNGTGNEQANSIRGNAAANTLDGAGGNDTLRGDAGDDTLIGGTGDDLFFVDSGADVVIEADGAGSDRVISTAAAYTLGAGVDHLSLGAGALDGVGNDLANWVTGNAEANNLQGSAGNDTLQGGAGADSLAGGVGNDILIAGSGVDVLTGGAGADIFRVTGLLHSGVGAGARDVLLDFVRGTDRIDLSRIDANGKVTGDQAFTLIQGEAFSRTAGELRYVQNGGSLVLVGDVNGDAVADFQLEIVGTRALTVGDLLL